ncbi:hypothetical protein SAY86_025966 [Trapa natans]|uniref:Protein-S-isoprenylcysteine O-methyltransferase n=1 Tax=Trapa natans TaxID=22666 RepID=A0AAN7KDE6_TRANT|nr:hypothetical protein SAY86_025966 [Trapa natans]
MIELSSHTAYRQLSQLVASIIFFHGSEYILAVSFHGRSNVTLGSLLISKNYIFAMAFSFLEYFVETTFFPGLKEHWWVSNSGLVMIIIGEAIQKLAIITVGQTFTHLIRIYTWMITVWTQVMLCNPISTLGFTVIVWTFFARRIPYEEFFLRQFFGSEYEEYAKRVPSGMPFVK